MGPSIYLAFFFMRASSLPRVRLSLDSLILAERAFLTLRFAGTRLVGDQRVCKAAASSQAMAEPGL